MASVAEVLDKAADLIEPEGAWQTKWYYNDTRTCFCMVGAVAEASGEKATDVESGPLGDLLRTALFGNSGRHNFIHTWNDEHTQADAVAKLREAASLAREQSQ